jgi:small-conductance mechanosensitive channel
MADYPVTFNIARPEKFERSQVFLRILVLVLLSILAGAVGWIFGVFYLAVPVLPPSSSQGDPQKYLQDTQMPTILRWYLALYSYLAVLTDRFPTEAPETIISFELRPGGSPTVGSALMRLIYSIPSAIVLAILGIVAAVIWVIAVISILIQENYAEGLYNFQLGIMRWNARLLGYHASLVEQYPPFAVDTGPEAPAPSAPAAT